MFEDSLCPASPVYSVSILKTNQFMLYTVINAVCSAIHTKQINKPCGQKVQFLKVKRCGT